MVVICVDIHCMIINSAKIIYFLTDKSGKNTMKTGPNQGKTILKCAVNPALSQQWRAGPYFSCDQNTFYMKISIKDRIFSSDPLGKSA